MKAFKDSSAEKVKLLAEIDFMEVRLKEAIEDINGQTHDA
jgi:hypothetical protein